MNRIAVPSARPRQGLASRLAVALGCAALAMLVGCADTGGGGSDTMTGGDTSQDGDGVPGGDTAGSGMCGIAGCSETCCDGTCTDTDTNSAHCGACNNACADGTSCVGGICAAGCDGGILCGGTCVDVSGDPQNCGACGQTCSTAQVCVESACASSCPVGLSACSGRCVTLATDDAHCGACGQSCGAGQTCASSACVCADGFQDCDGDPANGCEQQGECACAPGESRPCYSGPDGTQGVGTCTAGTQSCNATGTGWALCTGEVRPGSEICANGLDDDCNDQVDEDADEDGDGYTRCGGDCCDSPGSGCAADPARVNPGAFDFPGNELDDDCDGTADNPPPTSCSSSDVTSGTTGDDLARAMELCTVSQSGSWGVVSAELVRSDGFGSPDNVQVGVLTSLGSIIMPQGGSTLATLSSGTARGVGQPGYEDPNSNYTTSSSVEAPSVYVDAHGGELQTAAGCPSGSTTVNDSAVLRLTLKAPTNAEGFSFDFRFLSSEYPVYLCTSFNDFFIALLDSEHPDVPVDHNISFDANGNPVSVNNAFFTTCVPRECGYNGFTGTDADNDGCPDSLSCDGTHCATSFGACPDGAAEILAYTPTTEGAGGTSWLTTTAGVVPGETFTLDFHIWDTSDDWLDSIVLLDNFEWRIEPTTVETFN